MLLVEKQVAVAGATAQAEHGAPLEKQGEDCPPSCQIREREDEDGLVVGE